LPVPASQQFIGPDTPMGANLVPGGATFRVWAPRATAVYVSGTFNGWRHEEPDRLVPDANGYWAGFVPGITDGAEYKFYVAGTGSEGYKRDPYARELARQPDYPRSNCAVRDPQAYPWHDQDFRPPAFHDLVIYQLHVGTFYAADAAGNDRRPHRVATFLDVLDRIEYLVELGVNAIEPLPVVEFPQDVSLGYNGVDYFSPEMAYTVPPGEVGPYLARVNALLAARGRPPLTAGHLSTHVGQLKVLIDLCHVWGLAVLLDVVYNHAGGDFGGGPKDSESLYFFDRHADGDNNNSLYFTGQGWAGGLVFAFWNRDVRQFLINNATFWLREYHADGFRSDEVSVIDRFGGWQFCQDLSGTVRHVRPQAPQVAEFWSPDPSWAVRLAAAGGAGFDLVWHDGLRDAVRGALAQAAGGRHAFVNLDAVRDRLYRPAGFDAGWRVVNYLENHDLLWVVHEPHERKPRVAALADATNSRSWYARSRARVATGLLLTAPGVPMLFMGQEFLEDKYWADNPDDTGHFIWWDGLGSDRAMGDHLRFTRELIALRRRQPALRGEHINVFHVHNGNRVLALHRWLEGAGRDVVVVASLNESTFWGYRLGFPGGGRWLEVFNSDVYDHWVNPHVAGNGGEVHAGGPPLHGLPASAEVVLPANGLLVFARDQGD
jgi:1,4-alpha-glucan branching enzyme